MTDSNNSNDNWWLQEAFSAVVQGLHLGPSIVKRMSYEQVLAHMDEGRLFRLVEPLPLSRPSEVVRQLEKAGGPQVLFSQAAQVAIALWSIIRQPVQVLRELSKATTVLLRAHQQHQLNNPQSVLRTLPVLAISAFVPGGGALRGDLAAILRGSQEDAPGLIKSYRIAALSGNEKVIAIDKRIQADPTWSAWVQTFFKEGSDIIRLCRPATCWEFPESHISERNGSSICYWLFRRG